MLRRRGIRWHNHLDWPLLFEQIQHLFYGPFQLQITPLRSRFCSEFYLNIGSYTFVFSNPTLGIGVKDAIVGSGYPASINHGIMHRRFHQSAPGACSDEWSRLLVPEVMVRGAEWAVVRPRLSYDELIGLDRLPAWLSPVA